ncbi:MULTISPECIES: YhgE/Pip domain-containing protein [Clostridium]|uniref:YhgE/Pip domain-containing protein n=1 Tax=Clostridium TaxID=1485 RepID=UPI00040607AC|nr:YhgE/Pip domain-containing protein [Clostridium cadaveris]MDU4952555.1 YhgE/Pip domain-containing protein [Clostridium sp.]UFH65396.1 YhgE/Pip domain-containing protein [Clostridium cadaveris]
MKNILKIFKRDVVSTAKNPIALIVVLAICIIPALYAWINIKACWDPYSNTSTIPVAIVNEDKGTKFLGNQMNVGEEVISNLEENKSIGWDFVSLKKGDMGLVDGAYYAMIVIPEDFSDNITSLTSNSPKKPQIIYKVNSKATPVVGKITEVAQEKIVGEITTNFISTVNKTVFEKVNIVGEDLESKRNELVELRKGIIYANKHLDEIENALDNGSLEAEALNSYLVELKTSIPQMTDGIQSLENSTTNAANLGETVQQTLNQSFNNIRIILNDLKVESMENHSLVQDINESSSEEIKSNITNDMIKIEGRLNVAITSSDSIIKYLESLNKTANNEEIAKLILSLRNLEETLNKEKDNLSKLEKYLLETNNINSEVIALLNDLTNKSVQESTDILLDYDNNARPQLNSISKELISSTKDAAEILKTSEGLSIQINNMLSLGIEGSNLAGTITKDLSNKLKDFKGIISVLGSALEKTNEDDLIAIISILQSDPNLMGNYISSPINLKEEPVYGIPNYGSAMAPVYSVLALWVGALMLISVLKVNPVIIPEGDHYTPRQKYFGKLLYFAVLGMLQGLIVSIGDIFLLHVYTVNSFLLVMISVIIGLAFSTIVYTLMSVFGNLGKVAAIILMVVQLAGSGGTYPIQVDPLIFRIFQPFFPFTYAIGGYREAIAGPLSSKVALDIVVLLSYVMIFILIGFFLKKPLYSKIKYFEESFEESGVGE